MKQVTLRRREMGDQGTFGELAIDGIDGIFHTGELPWRDNLTGKSCVPAGTYSVQWDESGKYGHKYHLRDVPGRTHILIHAANLVGNTDAGYEAQVDGCIALGGSRGEIDNQSAVLGSKVAVARFEDLMRQEPFRLTITDEWQEAGEIPANVA